MLASVIRFILNCKLSGKLQVIYNLNFLPISLLHYWRQFIHSFSCFMEKQHHFSNTEMNSKYLFQHRRFEQKYLSNLSKNTISELFESFKLNENYQIVIILHFPSTKILAPLQRGTIRIRLSFVGTSTYQTQLLKFKGLTTSGFNGGCKRLRK